VNTHAHAAQPPSRPHTPTHAPRAQSKAKRARAHRRPGRMRARAPSIGRAGIPKRSAGAPTFTTSRATRTQSWRT
jgi:hypothetical protein